MLKRSLKIKWIAVSAGDQLLADVGLALRTPSGG